MAGLILLLSISHHVCTYIFISILIFEIEPIKHMSDNPLAIRIQVIDIVSEKAQQAYASGKMLSQVEGNPQSVSFSFAWCEIFLL